MRHRLVYILLSIAAIAAIFRPMAAFAVSNHEPALAQVEADEDAFTGYLQFSGCGRWVLSEDGTGGAGATLVGTSDSTPTDEGMKWTLTVTDGKAILQSSRGRYLRYADGNVSTTADASQASTFTWSVNTYYKDVSTRHQLLLPGQTDQALGVRGGKLCVVKANSRYAVIYTATEVHGADLPDFSDKFISHYYNVGTIWGSDLTLKDYLGTEKTDGTASPGAVGKLTNDAYRWKVLEENELGDIVLQNRSGYYLMQNDKTQSIKRTTSASEAAVFELVEGTDLGSVMWKGAALAGNQWYDYWQLRNKNITGESWYFFEGNDQRYGDSENLLPTMSYGDKTNFGLYSYAANRVVFKDTNLTEATSFYVQFSGCGRTILSEDNTGKAKSEEVDAGAPTGNGRKWVPQFGTDGTTVVLKSLNGRYLRYAEGAFSTTTSEGEATTFTWALNHYYTDVNERHQLLLPDDATQAVGVRDGKLTVVKADSRYAVVYLAEAVNGPLLPKLSDKWGYTYYMHTVWGGNKITKDYLYADLSKSPSVMATEGKDDNYKTDAHRWMMVEANDLGDVKLMTRGGVYLTQTDVNSGYTVTSSSSEAAVFQLVEAVDQGQVWWTTTDKNENPSGAYVANEYWPSFWQLKNTANGTYFFEGDKNQMGGLNNDCKSHVYGQVDNFAQYLFAFNRVQFLATELEPDELKETFSYVQFSGTGRTVLVGNTRSKTMGIDKPDADDTTPSAIGRNYKWSLLKTGTADQVVLHAETADLYLAYDETNGFSLTDDVTKAHAFVTTTNTYYADGPARSNLQSATLTDKALGVVDNKLQWVAPDTRFSVVHLCDEVKGTAFPALSTFFDRSWYNIALWYGEETENTVGKSANYLGTDTSRATCSITKPTTQSNAYLWSFEQANESGDVYVKNKSGLYLYQASSTSTYTFTADRSRASVMRLYEWVDGGEITFDGKTADGQTWDRFWQMKAVDGSFLFVGWQNNIGGQSSGGMNGKANQMLFGFANNRMEFELMQHDVVDVKSFKGYLQFSGQGRTVLVQDDESATTVAARFIEAENDSLPQGKGYQWQYVRQGDQTFKLTNGFGKYLQVQADDGTSAATFGVTDSEDGATLFLISHSTYYEYEGLSCWNFALAADPTRAIGVRYDDEGAHLALVPTDSRYAVVRWADAVRGPHPASYLGESEKVYNLSFQYYYKGNNGVEQSVNYVKVDVPDNKLYAATSYSDKHSMASMWRVGEANEQGDIYLVSLDGSYVALGAKNYTFTRDASKKAVFRPVECSNPHAGSFWSPYWQLRDVSTGCYMFIGWEYAFGGQGNVISDGNKGQYGYVNNRMQFEETVMAEGYFMFSAFGPYPLSDNGGTKLTVHAAHEKNDDKGAVWTIVPSTEGHVSLRNRNGNYITWSESKGFALGTDAQAAYSFTLQESTYEHNAVTRYLFLNTEGTHALRATSNGTDGILDWTADGAPLNTRFTAVHFFSMIAGPTLPDANGRGTKLNVYNIVTTNALSYPTGAATWSSGAHYYFNEQLDRSNRDADQKVTFSVLPDIDYTGVGEESNTQKYSGGYWVVERVTEDWTYDGKTYKGTVGDYYIRSYEDNLYLSYDATAKRFVTTSSKDKAAVVRPVEDDADLTSWQLQLVNAPDATNDILCFAYDVDATTKAATGFYIGLTAPGKNQNYVHFNYVDLHAECFGDTNGAYRLLQFINEADKPYIAPETDEKVTANATTVNKAATWKLVGDDSGNFVLVNPQGFYVSWNGSEMVTVKSKAEATHFSLMQNTNKSSEYITWCLCVLDADGKLPDAPQCVQRKADGTLTLVDYVANQSNTDTGIYLSERITPRFSDDTHTYMHYLQVKSDALKDGKNVWYYLNGNVDGGFLANGTTGKEMNYQTSSQGKVEFLNKQLWAFVREGKSDGTADYLIMTRDYTYLAWGEDEDKGILPAHFTTTTDRTKAAHFQFYLDTDNLDSKQYVVEYLPEADDEVGENRYLAFRQRTDMKGTGTWLLTLQSLREPTVQVEDWSVADAEDYKAYSILHKRSWFVKQVADGGEMPMTGFVQPDDIGTEGWETNPNTHTQMQKTNTYTIHHYFKDGTSGFLHLPTYMKRNGRGSATSSYITMYERFYDYQTGGDIDPLRVILKRRSRRSYKNGTIMGRKLYLNDYYGAFVGEGITFQMPPVSRADYRYTVAVDASCYTDFVDYFGDNGVVPFTSSMSGVNAVAVPSNQDLVEPTLSARYLYVIHNAREMAEQMEECAENASGDGKWLEEHTIAFPKKKVGFKNSTLPLDYQLRDYWFYNTASKSSDNVDVLNELLHNVTSYKDLEFEVDDATNTAGIALYYDQATQDSDDKEVDDKWPIDEAEGQYQDLREKRFVRFLYPALGTDGKPVKGKYAHPRDMGEALGGQAVVKVYAVARDSKNQVIRRFRLAKFNLTFEDGTEPRPDQEIIGYANVADSTYKSDRAPRALQRNYGEPRASISFNPTKFKPFITPPFGKSWLKVGEVDPRTTYDNSYGYPLDYERSSYNFQPFVYQRNGENTWGSYTIAKRMRVYWVGSCQNDYVPVRTLYKEAYQKYEPTATDLDDTNAAFMYIDASELPGTICSLQYSDQLCKGSRLYVSAWISSPDYFIYRTGDSKGRVVSPANVILSVKGIIQDAQGNRKEKVLYTYCPGPIFDVARTADGKTLERGAGERGIWQQIFFTFLNNDPDIENFHHYELTIDNACTTSDGGDILLDEVAVYSQKPEVMMEHTTPVCGQEVTLAKLSCDYESLMNQLELKENEAPLGGEPYMWYCLLDKSDYEAALQGVARPTTDQVKAAFKKALVGDPEVTTGEDRAFRKVQFSTDYSSLEPFNYKKALTELSDVWVSRETTTDGVRRMVISDKVSNSKMRPRRDYYLLFMPRSADAEDITMDNAVDAFQWGTDCCIQSTFRTSAAVTFYDDNDSTMVDQDNRVQVCANQSINVAATLNGVSINNGRPLSFYSYNDWWLDYEGLPFLRAYINASGKAEMLKDESQTPSTGSVSIREALTAFRHFYPKASSLKDVEPQNDQTAGIELTEAMISGLGEYLKSTSDYYDVAGNKVEKGNGAPLHLYSPTLNVTIVGDADKLEGSKNVITFVPILPEENDSVIYCYEPVQFTIEISGVAPSMMVGFREREDIYPSSYTSTVVRTGQDFLSKVSSDSYVNPPSHMLRLPMRKVWTKSEAAVGVMKIKRDGVEFAPVYLVGTDDDKMSIYDPKTNSSFRIIGVVHDIEASKDFNTRAFSDVYFLNDFKPREGYTYTLRMGFVEKFFDDHVKTDEEAAVCDGSLTFRLQIVPRYVKWTADAEDFAAKEDWTNDENWSRADRADLHLGTDAAYVSNADNGTSKGFIPLSFTDVLVGQGSTYPFTPILSDRLDNNRELAADNRRWEFLNIESSAVGTGVVRTATDDVEYDLIADDTGLQETEEGFTVYNTRPFFTYQCHDLVLLNGGEIVRSDLLASYHKAWMEYGLKAGRWYTLGSPFQRMYAGDWYAPTKGGCQFTPYFSDITFSPSLHDRFAPAVYQRGWDKGKATVYYLENGTGQSQNTDVAVRADWSAVYNDVQEQYAGGGFSLKANAEGRGQTYTDLLFRLPKEDDSFEYYSFDNQHIGNAQKVDRQGDTQDNLTGRFLTDALTSEDSELKQTLTNHEPGNRFFLVGNPFPCGLNMRQFFDANKDVLGESGWKYWLLTEKGQTAVMRGPGAEGWLSVNAASSQNGMVAPGQGFFVEALADKVSDGADGSSITLKFTPKMMDSASQEEVSLLSVSGRQGFEPLSATNSVTTTGLPTLRIRADRGEWHSEAAVVKSASASKGYDRKDDMPLLWDGALDEVPMVYTVADSVAVSVSHRRTMWRVPLGVASHSTDSVQLTFSGMDSFHESLSLLDEETGSVTPLTLSSTADNGGCVSVTVPGITSGRYYLLTSEQPSADDMDDNDRPMVVADGSFVSITSSAAHPLTSVRIVDVAGRELYHFAPFTSRVRMRLGFGAYVVEASSDQGTTVAKVTLKE